MPVQSSGSVVVSEVRSGIEGGRIMWSSVVSHGCNADQSLLPQVAVKPDDNDSEFLKVRGFFSMTP